MLSLIFILSLFFIGGGCVALIRIFPTVIAAFIMKIYAYIYMIIAFYFFDEKDAVEHFTIIMWCVIALLIVGIFIPRYKRTTKSGKADKRFKDPIDHEDAELSFTMFCVGIFLAGLTYLLDNVLGLNIILQNYLAR